MKPLLVIACLLLVRVGAATALPADTVKGQARFVQHLSGSMCQYLGPQLQGKEIGKLTIDECQSLLSKVTFQAMADNSDEFRQLPKQPGAASTSDLSRQVGNLAAMNLVESCPAGNALLVRVAMLSSNLPEGILPVERTLLQPIVQTMCQRLQAAYAAPATASRSQLLQSELRSAILAHSTELTEYYGEDLEDESKAGEQIGQRIGILMLEQCPRYLLLATQDEQAARRATATPAKATPPTRPAPKASRPPVRRAAGK